MDTINTDSEKRVRKVLERYQFGSEIAMDLKSVVNPSTNIIRLFAGQPDGKASKARLGPIKPIAFEIPYKMIRQSVVLGNMFKEDTFLEGITKTAVFPEFSDQVLADIVAFLQGSLLRVSESKHAIKLFLAAEYLQIRPLKKLCARAIAQDFQQFQSFGSLPDNLISDILIELDALQLCIAESILKRHNRQVETAGLWQRIRERTYPEASSVPDSKTFVIQTYFAKAVSLYSPALKQKQPMFLTQREGCDHLGALRPALTYMAPHVQRFVLKNTNLHESAIYSIILRLSSAEELRLESNQLSAGAGMAIGRAIRQAANRELVNLDLSNNRITATGIRSWTAAASPKIASRQMLPSLQNPSRRQNLTLCLADNHVGDPFVIEISSQIGHIQALDLSHNRIGCHGGQAFASALYRLRCLKHLSLRSCALDACSITTIMESILAASIRLAYLDISDNIETVDRFYTGKLDQLVMTTTTLSQLKIGGNKFSCKSILSFAEALRSSTHLQTLDMQAIELESTIRNVALACQESRTIKSLNLASCGLTPKSILNVASVIAYNNSLKTLNISGNEFDGEASSALRLALQQNGTLTSLIINAGIGGNGLNRASFRNIVAGLQQSVTIKRLSMINHKIGNFECAEAIQLVFSCPKLTYIDLRGNRICDRGFEAIVHSLIENRHAISRPILLDLRANDLTSASERLLSPIRTLLPSIRILDRATI